MGFEAELWIKSYTKVGDSCGEGNDMISDSYTSNGGTSVWISIWISEIPPPVSRFSISQLGLPSLQPNRNKLHMTLQSYLHSAAKYMRSGLATSTLKMYDTAWSHFSSFCATFSVNILPVNVSYVSAFIVHCFESCKMQPLSIKSMIAGIQFHLQCLDPSTISLLENSSIRLLLNGLKKEKPKGNDQRLPLTLPLLKKLISRLREGCFGIYSDMILESVLLWLS